MKTFTLTTISIFAALAASPSFAQLKTPLDRTLNQDFKGDVDTIDQALRSAEFNVGDASKGLEKEKYKVISELLSSAAKVESMSARVEEISRHFAALRSGGISHDDPEQLEAFCAKGNLTDLSAAGEDKIIAETYDAEAAFFDRLKQKLKPVADEMFNATAGGFKLADIEVPGDYGPEAAKAYIDIQEKAQRKAYDTRVNTQLIVENAATRAGWAAFRIREKMKKNALASLASSRKPGSELGPMAGTVTPQNACRAAVNVLKERRELATSGQAPQRSSRLGATPGF